MKPAVYRKFTDLIYAESGIKLPVGKETLLTARIGKRMRSLSLSTEEEYFDFVISDTSGQELVQLLDVISTNVTHFFRENDHFKFLTGFLDEAVQRNKKKLRIWSAACSTGEEVYTIGMVISSIKGIDSIDWKILGTDISTRVLTIARNARYEEEKVKKIDSNYLRKYFVRFGQRNEQGIYEVVDSIRSRTRFARLNLSEPPFPMKGPFDVVFCRNVMIYFDEVVRNRLLGEIDRLLAPNGVLIVGSAESLVGLASGFSPVKPSIYRKSTGKVTQ